MTMKEVEKNSEHCPAQALLKLISGKWKPEIFSLAVKQPVRFSTLLKEIEGSNKQSISVALKELEESDILKRIIIQEKPLHIEYILTEKGKSLTQFIKQLEQIS